MRRNRRPSVADGPLTRLLVLLLAGVPPLVWQLAGETRPESPTSHGMARADVSQVTWGTPIRVSGSLRTPLTPGQAVPVALRFVNPHDDAITMHRVHIRIIGIDAPQADAAHPCTRRDFRIRQMPRRALPLPARGVTRLADLAVPLRGWPRLKLRNRPGNQDGCRGAQLTLGYRAYGRPPS